MEDSAYSSLMISVYVIIFVIATSITVYLFSTTVSFADKAYEYGKTTTGTSVIEVGSKPDYSTVTGAELLTYYYNYKSSDKYGTAITPKYNFSNIDSIPININKTYALIYESANTGANPVIKVIEVPSDEIIDTIGGVVIDKRPIDPTLDTSPSTDETIPNNSIVEFESTSSVNYSFANNSITKYYWKIEYSAGDGRADFTTTTLGATSKLLYSSLGDKIKFRSGVNTVSVTAEDAFGNKSNTVSKTISLGNRNPVINYLKEANAKVNNNGTIDIETASGVILNFIGDAVSKNVGGYIQKYDWYVNNVLVQSSATGRLTKEFTPGNYTIKLKVYDSFNCTSEQTFAFKVNAIPAPVITCSNTAITTNHTLAISNSTVNLTFNATLASRYSIVRYVWTIDGTNYQTTVPNGINLNYGIGTHNVSVYGVNSSGLTSAASSLSFTITEDFIPFTRDYAYNGSYYTETLPAGKYTFEVWGAKGGNGSGGNGSYAQGQINLTTSRTVYIYVGGSNGYNGGGSSRLAYSYGGGATDIRLNSGAWNNITSLRSRIIVAGGGAGNGGTSVTSAGASAGNLTGYTGGDHYGDPGTGGTQTSGGSAGRLNAYGATNGSFGIGGNGETASVTSAGAGGGGYYGGGGASSDLSRYNDLDDSGGGGGSSFISGYSGCNAVDVNGNHTWQANHYSGLVFTNSSMVGATNTGYGMARITHIR